MNGFIANNFRVKFEYMLLEQYSNGPDQHERWVKVIQLKTEDALFIVRERSFEQIKDKEFESMCNYTVWVLAGKPE